MIEARRERTMHLTPQATTRRAFLHRGLGLAFGLATLLGATRVPVVAADKKKPKKLTVAERTQSQRELCEVVAAVPGKTGGVGGAEWRQHHGIQGRQPQRLHLHQYQKDTTCWQARTEPPTSPLDETTAPPLGGNEQPPDGGTTTGGGGAVDPTGGNEQPVGGGNNAGGGGCR
jgi:hypothetical protein